MSAPKPKLRSDLEVLSIRRPGKSLVYLLKDPLDQRVFEFEEAEFFLCQQFDGVSDTKEVCEIVKTQLGHLLQIDDLEAFVRRLDNEGLLERSEPDVPSTTQFPTSKKNEIRLVPTFNLPLGDPDWVLGRIAQKLGWCASKPILYFLLFVLFLGIVTLIRHWRTWFFQIIEMGIPSSMPLIIGIWFFGILVPKEIITGLVCKYYHVQVRAAGIRFIYYVVPKFYLDTSRANWVQKKRSRLWIIFSGSFFVLIAWAVGMNGWLISDIGSRPNIFFLALSVIAGFWSLLVIWNPLRRNDAAQLLSVWLEIPRLYERAIRASKAWVFREPLPEPLSPGERKGFRWYGLFAGVWFIFFIGGLIFTLGDWLTTYYKGAGVFAFSGILAFSFYRPIKAGLKGKGKMALATQSATPSKASNSKWRYIKAGILVCLIILLFLPYPYTVGGPVQLFPIHQLAITSEIDGIIEIVRVREGQWVKKGEIVAKLVQRDYRSELITAQASLREAQAQLDLLLAGPKPEEVAKAKQTVRSAQVQIPYSEAHEQRLSEIFKNGYVSRQDYDNALNRRDADREALKSALASLALVQSGFRPEEILAQKEEIFGLEEIVRFKKAQVENTIIYSPLDGWVITPRIHEIVGKGVKAGEELGRVEDARVMQAEILLLEDDVGLVEVAQPVKFRPWAFPNSAFPGQMVEIAPVAFTNTDQETKVVSETVRAIMELPNPERFLKTGMTGYAKVQLESEPVWWVLSRRIYNWFQVEFWSWWP